MDQFTPQTIGSLLLIGIVLALAVGGYYSWCRRVDARPAYDPLRDGPEDTNSAAMTQSEHDRARKELGFPFNRPPARYEIKQYREAYFTQIMEWFNKFGWLGLSAFVLLTAIGFVVGYSWIIIALDLWDIPPENNEPSTTLQSVCNWIFLMSVLFGALVFLDAYLSSPSFGG